SPGRGSIPSYPSPERAVNALSRVIRYAACRERPKGSVVRPGGLYPDRAHGIVRDALDAAGTSEADDVVRAGTDDANGDGADEDVDDTVALTEDAVVRLLACYGIEVVPFRLVSDEDEAVDAAAELGYPVALKVVDERLRGTSDLLGVRLDPASEHAVRTGCAALREVSGFEQIYVQQMATKGVSCVLGLQDDPSFGTLVSFGLAGVVSTLLGDRAYRALPLTDVDATTLLHEPRSSPLLTGYQGTDPVDLSALRDMVLRLAALAEDNPEVRSLALEPVLVSTAGVRVASARAVV